MKNKFFLLPVFLCVFTSCTLFNQLSKNGTITFTVDKTLTSQIKKASAARAASREADSEQVFLELSVNGDYSAVKTLPITESDESLSLSFTDIPVGAEIYVEASIYILFKVEGEEKRIELYSGKSEKMIIQEGSNNLELALNKVVTETSDENEEEPVKEEEKDDEEEQQEEPSVLQITIYVSASGDDDTGTGEETAPFKSIAQAVSTMNQEAIYTLMIDGTLGGAQQTIENVDSSVIEIILTGKNGSDDSGEPQDALDRGIEASTNGSTDGNVLIVDTEVPVTITNLKLMRGAAADGSALKVTQGSTVKLGDGLRVIKNYYQSGKGTVRNEGTLFMYGDAVIGDATATTYAADSSTASLVTNGDNANYSGTGGGIYNGNESSSSTIVAKLYLGYSGYDSDGVTPVKKTLTGGIYKNGGGGIYNSYNSFVYFDSGTIAWNASMYGAGLRNYQNATFEMSGGNIINNKCESASDIHGGGVSNENNSSKFIMSGGTINQNIVNCTNTASSSSHGYGGGVYNAGYMFMYGSAVIGNKSASDVATSSDYGNFAREGGGIYNASTTDNKGKLYIGYEPGSDGITPIESELTGGIYQNYANTLTSQTNGGGGIGNANILKISSGTIAYNATTRLGGGIYSSYAFDIAGGTIRNNSASSSGGAIYMTESSTHILTLGGSFDIPKGDGSNDIYLAGSGSYFARIQIASSLDGSLEVMLTPEDYTAGHQLVGLTSSASGVNLEAEVECFEVMPQIEGDTTANWELDSNGKLAVQTGGAGIDFTFTEISSEGDIEVTNAGDGSFVASNDYVSYSWSLDGEVVEGATTNEYTVDLSTLSNGTHDIYLEVQDSDGNYYSWSGQYSKS